MDKLKIYGERNSGTHFITRLIQRNFKCSTIPGTLADAEKFETVKYRHLLEVELKNSIQDEFKRKLADSIKVDEFFAGNQWLMLGWKHSVPPLETIATHPDRHQVLFVTVTKNPYAWALSMFRRPYGDFSLNKPDNFSHFLTEPWITAQRDNCPSLLNSPIELWNLKTNGYQQLALQGYHVLNIRYEDVINDSENFLISIEHYLERKPKKVFFLNHSTKKEDEGKKDFEYYQDYYLNQRWKDQLSEEDILTINHFLNPQIVERAGYQLID